jgi:hypothetical protein
MKKQSKIYNINNVFEEILIVVNIDFNPGKTHTV